MVRTTAAIESVMHLLARASIGIMLLDPVAQGLHAGWELLKVFHHFTFFNWHSFTTAVLVAPQCSAATQGSMQTHATAHERIPPYAVSTVVSAHTRHCVPLLSYQSHCPDL